MSPRNVRPARYIMEAGRRGSTQIRSLLFSSFSRGMGRKRRIKMFGKAKGSSHDKDELLPAAPQLQDLTPESDSTEISSIGPGMTVVGNISSEGILNVFGRVEGELHASIVRISDGAEVEGVIAAQELKIGGRFKGTIQANRVTLTSYFPAQN